MMRSSWEYRSSGTAQLICRSLADQAPIVLLGHRSVIELVHTRYVKVHVPIYVSDDFS